MPSELPEEWKEKIRQGQLKFHREHPGDQKGRRLVVGRLYNKATNIDWSDLATLAPNHTVKEIMELKSCSTQAVRRALEIRGLTAKGAKRGRLKFAVEIVAVESPKIRIMCKWCGKRLEVTPWNKVTNMAYCVNFKCRLFRNPVMHPKLKIEKESNA